MSDVGPNFDKGVTRIGRRRLPAGFMALLDDPETLRLAIRELRDYAISGAKLGKRGIVFRLVTAQERQAILFKLQNLLGMDEFTRNSTTFHIPEGHWHAIDSEHLIHVCNRYTDPELERHGQPSLVIEDMEMIPKLIDPRNIYEFASDIALPRIKYRREVDNRVFILVEEIRAKGGIVLKTFYREK